MSLFSAGKHEESRTLCERLIAANAVVTRKLGVPALKLAMDWRGFYGGPTRAPLLPLTDAQMVLLRADLQSSGLLPQAKL